MINEPRFEFGRNWSRFLELVDEERISSACSSLKDMLQVSSLEGRSFVDVGCGSGLFSLAAARLGACRIHSFDFDQHSVGCADELRHRCNSSTSEWTIERGDALDDQYIANLGQYDVVYSWGVLHHTGNLWKAIENTSKLVRPEGTLYLALYNDQGRISKIWTGIKRIYCSGILGKLAMSAFAFPYLIASGMISDVLARRNPLARYTKPRLRGMSAWVDLADWVGGYPFEVAGTGEVFNFLHRRGFGLVNLKSVGGGSGCNEYVFRLDANRPPAAP